MKFPNNLGSIRNTKFMGGMRNAFNQQFLVLVYNSYFKRYRIAGKHLSKC